MQIISFLIMTICCMTTGSVYAQTDLVGTNNIVIAQSSASDDDLNVRE